MICTLEIASTLVVSLFQPGLTKFKVHSGLPNDAEIVGCEYCVERDTVVFHIQSSEFTGDGEVPIIVGSLDSPYEAMARAMER